MKIGQALWLQNDMVFQSSNAVFSSEPMSESEDFLQKKNKKQNPADSAWVRSVPSRRQAQLHCYVPNCWVFSQNVCMGLYE